MLLKLVARDPEQALGSYLLAGLLCAVLLGHYAPAQAAGLGTCAQPVIIPGFHAGDSRYNGTGTVVVGEGISTCTNNGSVTYHLTAVDAPRVLIVTRCIKQPQKMDSTDLWRSRILVYQSSLATCSDPNTWQGAYNYGVARVPLGVGGYPCAGQPGLAAYIPANRDYFITVDTANSSNAAGIEGISASNCGSAALNITEVVKDQWIQTGSCQLPIPALFVPPPGTSTALMEMGFNPCICPSTCMWPGGLLFNRSVASFHTVPPVVFDGTTVYGLDVCGHGEAPTWNMQLAVFVVQHDMCKLTYGDLMNTDNGLLLNMQMFGPDVVCGTGSAYLMFRPPAGSQIQIAVMGAKTTDCGPINLLLQAFGPSETLPGLAPDNKAFAPHPPAPPLPTPQPLAQRLSHNNTTAAVAAGVAAGCAAVLVVALLVWAQRTGRLSSCGGSHKGPIKADTPHSRSHAGAPNPDGDDALGSPGEEGPVAVVVVGSGDGSGAKRPQLPLPLAQEAPLPSLESSAAAHQRARAAEAAAAAPYQPQNSQHDNKDNSGRRVLPPPSSSAHAQRPPPMLGLDKDDPFMRSTARHLRWAATAPEGAWALEEGVTWHSAGSSSSGSSSTPDNAAHSDVGGAQQLTAAQVANELELFADGLIGRGSTALVFRCRWPRRFGPTALLAAKVLRDSYDPDSRNTAAFHHEARVLAACAHPNVVRMYGCCLEKPALVLVLELLPGSLKHRLYSYKLPHLQHAASQHLPMTVFAKQVSATLPNFPHSAATTAQASSAATPALSEQRSTQPSV